MKEIHNPPHTQGPFSLEWDCFTVGQWSQFVKDAPKSNMLLLWSVAKTTFQTRCLRPQFGIFKENGHPLALVVATTRKFLFFKHITVHRGPVWLIEAQPTYPQKEAVFKLLKQAFGYTTWHTRFSIMPELEDTPENNTLLENVGFQKTKIPGYQSAWLDLRPSLEDIKKEFRANWASHLKKAHKKNFRYEVDPTFTGYKLFLRGYRYDKKQKKYKGPSLWFLMQFFRNAKKDELFLCEAWHEGVLIGAQLFCIHGRAATYFVGWTTPEGRPLSAHNGLLFEAICRLKDRNIEFLDLGGLTPQAPGLNHFKLGTGAAPFTLVGTWKA